MHPGLEDKLAAKPLRDALVAVLERNLAGAKLTAMAVMGLADGGPEPWEFMAMAPVGPGVIPNLPNGSFIPVHGPALDGTQFAEALAVLETPHQVVPTPAPNNLNPITCNNAALPAGPAALPVADRKGVGHRGIVRPWRQATDQRKGDRNREGNSRRYRRSDA